jgi:hypothetical protein
LFASDSFLTVSAAGARASLTVKYSAYMEMSQDDMFAGLTRSFVSKC